MQLKAEFCISEYNNIETYNGDVILTKEGSILDIKDISTIKNIIEKNIGDINNIHDIELLYVYITYISYINNKFIYLSDEDKLYILDNANINNINDIVQYILSTNYSGFNIDTYRTTDIHELTINVNYIIDIKLFNNNLNIYIPEYNNDMYIMDINNLMGGVAITTNFKQYNKYNNYNSQIYIDIKDHSFYIKKVDKYNLYIKKIYIDSNIDLYNQIKEEYIKDITNSIYNEYKHISCVFASIFDANTINIINTYMNYITTDIDYISEDIEICHSLGVNNIKKYLYNDNEYIYVYNDGYNYIEIKNKLYKNILTETANGCSYENIYDHIMNDIIPKYMILRHSKLGYTKIYTDNTKIYIENIVIVYNDIFEYNETIVTKYSLYKEDNEYILLYNERTNDVVRRSR